MSVAPCYTWVNNALIVAQLTSRSCIAVGRSHARHVGSPGAAIVPSGARGQHATVAGQQRRRVRRATARRRPARPGRAPLHRCHPVALSSSTLSRYEYDAGYCSPCFCSVMCLMVYRCRVLFGKNLPQSTLVIVDLVHRMPPVLMAGLSWRIVCVCVFLKRLFKNNFLFVVELS